MPAPLSAENSGGANRPPNRAVSCSRSRPLDITPPAYTSGSCPYSCSSANVRMTMIAGRILYEDGEYRIGIDPGQICAEAEQAAKEIAG